MIIHVKGEEYEVILGKIDSENEGKIVRAVKFGCNGLVPASVYRKCYKRDGAGQLIHAGWENACPLTISAFRAGVRRGTMDVM